jgi:cell division septation protein DedD
LAHDKVLRAEVALKLLPQDAPDRARAEDFFEQEATLGLKLRHPQILGVLHVDRAEGILYLVEEPFPGESLASQLTRQRHFLLPQALHPLELAARALAFAHSQGVAHQSFNPLNILMEDRDLRVANFAFPPGNLDQALALELRAYEAPETVQGEPPAPAANVFSLGVLGFRLIAGSLPYPLTFDEPFPYRLEELPADLEEIPLPLQNLLLRCLAEEPEDRFADAGAFGEQLKQLREHWLPEPSPRRREERRVGDLKPALRRAGEMSEKAWAAFKPWGQKAGQALAEGWAKYRPTPGMIFKGLGVAGLLAVILIGGYKLRGYWQSRLPAKRPSAVASAPLKLPELAGGPPIVESPDAPPAGQPPAAIGAPVSPPGEGKAPAKTDRYLLLVATYGKEDQARSAWRRLKAGNIKARIVKTKSGAKNAYQVVVGPVAGTMDQAEELAGRIQNIEGVTPKIRRLESKSAAKPSTSKAAAKSTKSTKSAKTKSANRETR